MKLRKARRTYGHEVNMTPMIDIIFQLIIFFMVVSQFTSIAVETLTLPEAKKGEEAGSSQADRIVVNVHDDGRIVLLGEEHTAETLADALEKQLEGQDKAKVPIVLRADTAAAWETAAAVLRAVGKCGMSRVRIAVTEPKDKGSED